MCENTLLERLMDKLDEAGANSRATVEASGDLRFALGMLIRKAVRHEVLFDGGLMAEARMWNWCVHDQESCTEETPNYATRQVASTIERELQKAKVALENKTGYEELSKHLVVMYAAILGLEYTVRRLYGKTPTIEDAPDF